MTSILPPQDLTPWNEEQKQEAAQKLSPEARRILLNQGTEPPFCGGLLDNKEEGLYHCGLCELPLFSSEHKFESGSGWPSFYQPLDRDFLHYVRDTSAGMIRTEIRCARCDGHLGHVFDDGPRPTGERYCLNSVALVFYKAT
ncbi:peptide-methionine (R)-S-oxide reductase MsrB [Marinospirillum perlucidum]|uniref:peptide-methionine (R)-S-oxide reductase MsrB n=1 Tax=Marinospirillum perlucidum TaxID=1982602 RepID=UPI000DF2DF74|nr:peptide-methionine (R)-S-oxide reductase MsrB [Marinospirillum perlucidum]